MGGRTSRGSLGKMREYVGFLNELGADAGDVSYALAPSFNISSEPPSIAPLGRGRMGHNGFSTADAPRGRAADFFLGDVAIHVTTSPGEALMDRRLGNLDDGYRPIVVTLRRGLLVADELARRRIIEDRIDILDIEQFVAVRVYELRRPGQEALSAAAEAALPLSPVREPPTAPSAPSLDGARWRRE